MYNRFEENPNNSTLKWMFKCDVLKILAKDGQGHGLEIHVADGGDIFH